ncbi:MAG: TOBE domain-containing protein, partial [Janthinobacterium lividum]
APTLVMLDEPFSSLDAALRVETRQAVAAALEASGASAILVTHDQAEALSLGRQVAVLWQGKIIQTDRPEALYRRPVTRALASFIGEAVMLPGVARGSEVDCALGTLRLAAPISGAAVDVMIRPEQIALLPAASAAGADSAAAACFEARVSDVEFFGQDASIGLRAPALAPETNLRARVPGYLSPRPGETVRFTVHGEVMAYPRDDGAR